MIGKRRGRQSKKTNVFFSCNFLWWCRKQEKSNIFMHLRFLCRAPCCHHGYSRPAAAGTKIAVLVLMLACTSRTRDAIHIPRKQGNAAILGVSETCSLMNDITLRANTTLLFCLRQFVPIIKTVNPARTSPDIPPMEEFWHWHGNSSALEPGQFWNMNQSISCGAFSANPIPVMGINAPLTGTPWEGVVGSLFLGGVSKAVK